MPAAWRIVKQKYAATAFTGEGASRSGGRWNSHGTWVVYASGSKSLAALETLVHLNPPVLFSYVAFRLEFPEKLVERFAPAGLPANWTEHPPPPAAQLVGDIWVRSGRSAVLELPSVIIPGESNCLLNPRHPDFRLITIGAPEPFSFDHRLIS